jgi:hypothetical protein
MNISAISVIVTIALAVTGYFPSPTGTICGYRGIKHTWRW